LGPGRFARVSLQRSCQATDDFQRDSQAEFFSPLGFWSDYGLERFQQPAFLRREHPLGGHFRNLATKQGHQQHPPGDHRIDGDGAGQPHRRARLMSFNAATAFQHPMPILDVPAPGIILQATQRRAGFSRCRGWAISARPANPKNSQPCECGESAISKSTRFSITPGQTGSD
jgi:hypothetical protein